MTRPCTILAVILFLTGTATRAEKPGLPIFTPQQAASHYVWFPSGGEVRGSDPRVRHDADELTFLDVPVTGRPEDFGYLATRHPMRNYRLSLRYAWGNKRFPPRDKALRDSGLLYHMNGPDAIWPNCVECQIQEGETGDALLLWGESAPSASARQSAGAKHATFDPAGGPRGVDGSRVLRSTTLDTPEGWNDVEVIVNGDAASHWVNGREVNRLSDLRWRNGAAATEGRVALQVEGAEIRFRDVRVAPLVWPIDHEPFRVLVFSRTRQFRHDSIPDAVAAVKHLGERFGFAVDATEDAGTFTDERLGQYAVVMFLNTTGDVLAPEQERSFERFIRAGGGFVGVHSACDTEYGWPWYGKLVGTWFKDHPKTQDATVRLAASPSPSTSVLPAAWPRRDEWYNFVRAPSGVEILLTVDETTYEGGTMGEVHPLSWQHAYDGGRSWYTAMGHTSESYREPLFLLHLLGGIQYAAGLPEAK